MEGYGIRHWIMIEDGWMDAWMDGRLQNWTLDVGRWVGAWMD